MNNRRTNLEIIADILRLRQASKTQIMYNVGMSYTQLEKYLGYLSKRGFLTHELQKYPGGIYRVSHEGEMLLESIERISELLDMDEEDEKVEVKPQRAKIAPSYQRSAVSVGRR